MFRDGHQFTDRLALDDGTTSALKPAARRSSADLRAYRRGLRRHRAGCACPRASRAFSRRFREQGDAFGEHKLHVDAGFDLYLRVVVPRAVAVVPGFDRESPGSGRRRGQQALPAVCSLAALTRCRCKPDTLAFFALGVQQDGAHPQLVVAFTEDRGANHQIFTRQGLGREPAFLDHGLHGRDGESAEPKTFGDTGLLLGLGC